jgi:predicted kinase
MSLVHKFTEDFPDYIDAMRDTSHHANRYTLRESDGTEVGINPWHLEGDVWSHTVMVYNHSQHVNRLSPEVREALELSTLLHDLGKIATRKRSTANRGRIHFRGHAGVSSFMALAVMERWNIDKSVQRDVMQTISLHHSFMDMLSPFDEKTSQKVGGKFRYAMGGDEVMILFHQMACDALGRIDTEHATTFDSITMALGQWRELADHHTRVDLDVTPKPTVTVMVGLPASGKSQYAGKLGVPVVSCDAIVMEHGGTDSYTENWGKVDHKEIDRALEAKLAVRKKIGGDFVIDMTNVSPKARRRSLSKFNSSHHKKAVVMATSSREMWARNFKRKADGKMLGLEVLHKMMTSFTVPMYDEFDEIVYVFPDGEEVH